MISVEFAAVAIIYALFGFLHGLHFIRWLQKEGHKIDYLDIGFAILIAILWPPVALLLLIKWAEQRDG